ncbi:MAG: hypothetical protein PUB18_00895 [bacterium]|nr:hypothetical protein [bacterium]
MARIHLITKHSTYHKLLVPLKVSEADEKSSVGLGQVLKLRKEIVKYHSKDNDHRTC